MAASSICRNLFPRGQVNGASFGQHSSNSRSTASGMPRAGVVFILVSRASVHGGLGDLHENLCVVWNVSFSQVLTGVYEYVLT